MLKDLMMLKHLPQLTAGASYSLLFLVGLLTSFHCVGMCGGIVMTSCMVRPSYGTKEGEKIKWFKPSLFYNLGRVISYTLTGAIVGGLGQVLSLQGRVKGLIPLVGGVFMILMGVNLLGICPQIRRYLPHMPLKLAKKVYGQNNSGPFYIGVLTGLMPCGPLQILQMYALGTASAIQGAISMWFFAMGTVPLLFLFGLINTVITKKGAVLITRLSSVIVISMGITMTLQGLALAGITIEIPSKEVALVENQIQMEDGYQVIRSEIGESSFPDIVVVKGIPVCWILEVSQEHLNECNKAMVIPEYNLEKTFSIGENKVEFVPTKSGDFVYTCWMGMIKAHIRVVEDESQIAHSEMRAAPADDSCQKQYCTHEDMEKTKKIKTIKEGLKVNKLKVNSQEANNDHLNKAVERVVVTHKENATEEKKKEISVNEKVTLELQGYLQDQHCFNCIKPEEDTTFCLQMKECKASGYGFVSSDKEGKSKFYIFDEIGQEKAIELLNKTTKASGIKIDVKGYLLDGKLVIEELIER